MFGIGRVCRDNQCLALVEFVETTSVWHWYSLLNNQCLALVVFVETTSVWHW